MAHQSEGRRFESAPASQQIRGMCLLAGSSVVEHRDFKFTSYGFRNVGLDTDDSSTDRASVLKTECVGSIPTHQIGAGRGGNARPVPP